MRIASSPRHAKHGPACLAFVATALLALPGCTNLSGLGGTSTFQCKAPEGVPCMSVSGVSANERAGTLFTSHNDQVAHSAAPGTAPAASAPMRTVVAAPAGQPLLPLGAIRSLPTLLRLWVAPWEDTDGDLNDDSYVYLQVDAGRWLKAHNRQLIQRAFAPAGLATASPPEPQPAPSPAAAGATKQPASAVPASRAPQGSPR
ncbi:MAG: TraV family lipoprotein [Rubrivivax sp.]